MNDKAAMEQRRGGRGTVERRKRRRVLPTVLTLEGRQLLSTFTVNSTGDSGSGSGLAGDLRYCITQANSDGGDETIVFDKTVFKTPQTINLTGGQLELSDTTGTETIVGPNAGVTVDAGGNSRVFQVDGGVTASISGMTITGGRTSGSGGGLYNDGATLTLTNCAVSGNTATIYSYISGGGGGVFSAGGTTTLSDCTVSGNSAFFGGGLRTDDGTTILNNSMVSGNSAFCTGGLFAHGGTTILNNSTVSGNSANGVGGRRYGGGTTTLNDTTVSGNTGSIGGLYTSKGRNHADRFHGQRQRLQLLRRWWRGVRIQHDDADQLPRSAATPPPAAAASSPSAAKPRSPIAPSETTLRPAPTTAAAASRRFTAPPRSTIAPSPETQPPTAAAAAWHSTATRPR